MFKSHLFNGICSGDITVFRAKNELLLPALLPFIVHNEKFFDYAVKHSAGGLSPRVKFKDLANYEFLLPPKDQQAELAELLWAIDKVIDSEKRLSSFLRSIYERILFDFFENNNQRQTVKLGDYVTIRSGDSPSTFEFANINEGIPFYKVADLNESKKIHTYAKEWVKPIEKKIIPKGSVIFPKRGAAIMTNKVRITKEDCHVDTNIMALTLTNRQISNEFVFFLLNYSKLYKIADTSQIPQINNVHIKPFKFCLPSIEEQMSLIDRLNEILNVEDFNCYRLSCSCDLQKSLINQIF